MFLVDNITVRRQIMLVSHFQFLVAIDKLPWGQWQVLLSEYGFINDAEFVNHVDGHVKIRKI